MRKVIMVVAAILVASCGEEPAPPSAPDYTPPANVQCSADLACGCYALDSGWWQWRECPEPEPTCVIADSEAGGWNKVYHDPEMREEVEAAKVRVGERCGESPWDTLALVAEELKRVDVCAAGPWADALLVEASGGIYEEWHIVAFSDGCWFGRPYKGGWYHGG